MVEMNVQLFISLILAITIFSVVGRKLKINQVKDDIEELTDAVEGFKSEVHTVETEDGYILKVHRIKLKGEKKLLRMYPVFFMHGIAMSEADFIRRESEEALPFLLSSNGFDVWMGNARGNDHSRQHKTLKLNSKKFWNFSWHEIGFYDLPAMIDYMLKESNASKAFYVGHSQGTTSFFVMTSSRPEYNEKIIQAHLLTPAAFMKNFPNQILLMFSGEIRALGNKYRFLDIFSSDVNAKSFLTNSNNVLCHESSPMYMICEAVLLFACGRNKEAVEMDQKILRNFLHHLSHAVSMKQLEHYLQIIESGLFRRYDFQSNNRKVYNATTPPEYNLNKVEVPTYLYSGSCDAFVAERDVEHLEEVLPNVIKHKNFKNFNHCDFNYGKNAKQLVYDDIVNDMISA